MMLIDEIRGVIVTALDRDGMSASQTANLIKGRINGATDAELFAAAIEELREQGKQIAELEMKVEELGDDAGRLEDDITDLRAEIESLRARKLRSIP